ncbi:MAG: hypothetical protein ACXWNC_03470 [Anaerolineales bacterium]
MRKAIIIRVILSVLVGLLIGVIISEVSFRSQSNLSRSPGTVELVIPAGAAVKSSQGISLIPAGMTFVQGDVLVVHNYDNVTHTLGELYIPAGSTATMALNQPGNLVLSCSFRPSQTFGLDVRESITFGTRLQGIILAGVPLAVLLGLYSLAVWPITKAKAQL